MHFPIDERFEFVKLEVPSTWLSLESGGKWLGGKFYRAPGKSPSSKLGVLDKGGAAPGTKPLDDGGGKYSAKEKAAIMKREEEMKAKEMGDKTKSKTGLPTVKESREKLSNLYSARNYPKGRVTKEGKEYVTEIDGTKRKFKKQKDAIAFVDEFAEKETRREIERLSARYQQEIKRGVTFDTVQRDVDGRTKANVVMPDGSKEKWRVSADQGLAQVSWQEMSRIKGLTTPSIEVKHLGEKLMIYPEYPRSQYSR